MKVSRSALLPFSATQMYDIVADIAAYPTFLNWCVGAEIVSDEADQVVARLKVKYAKLNMRFTTRNHNLPGQSIRVQLVDGPFSRLNGEWKFVRLNDEACKVSLDMDFSFERSLARHMMSGVFKKIVTAQLDAFQARARELHGGSAGAGNAQY